MTAFTTTVRLASLAILIISLAPLGSIYVLLSYDIDGDGATAAAGSDGFASFAYYSGIGGCSGGEDDDVGEAAAMANLLNDISASITAPSFGAERVRENVTSLAELLNNPNATLEDVWTALFLERWSPQELGDLNPFLLGHFPIFMKRNTVYHLKALLPWMISFFFGVVVPTCLSIYSFFKHRRRRYNRSTRRQQRLANTVKMLKSYTKQLTPEDCADVRDTGASPCAGNNAKGCVDAVEYSGGSDGDCPDPVSEARLWTLPPPGIPVAKAYCGGKPSLSSEAKLRTVAGMCTVCLEQYRVGESVVYSPNPACQHAFHANCILEWLKTRKSSCADQLCPCCRQCFVLSSSEAAACDKAVSSVRNVDDDNAAVLWYE